MRRQAFRWVGGALGLALLLCAVCIHTSALASEATLVATPTVALAPTPTPLPSPSVPQLEVTLQQGRNGYTGSQDTYIMQYEPDNNYCTADLFKVGYHQQYASIVRFDVTSVPRDVLVTNAALQVYARGWDCTDIGIDAFYITRTVNLCQATWNQARTGANWGSAGCNDTATDRRAMPEDSILTTGNHQWYSFDLTAVVQGWVDGTLANNGVLLRASQYPYLGPFYFVSAENSDASLRPKLVVSYQLPAPVQLTSDLYTDPLDDTDPSLLRTRDGKLWVVWTSDRAGTYGNYDLWCKTSVDDGRIWSADRQLTTDAGRDTYPNLTQLADGRLWLVWDSDRSSQKAVWQRFSDDGGATWSTGTWVANMPMNGSYGSAVAAMQSDDGRLWVVGEYGPWFITSADGGVTWSSPTNLASYGFGPAVFQADDGKIWVVYSYERRYHGEDLGYALAHLTSTDGGVTWSRQGETVMDWWGLSNPSLAQTTDGTLVLMWDQRWRPYKVFCAPPSLAYRTSSDGGETWSGWRSWLDYIGHEGSPSMALLGNGTLGVVWESSRAGNPDIWFGILGQTADPTPPPYVCCLYDSRPSPIDSDDVMRVCVTVSGAAEVDGVSLVWTRDGTPQADLPMEYGTWQDWPDCSGGCGVTNSIQIGPFPPGAHITYWVRAVSSGGSAVLYGPRSFDVAAAPTPTPSPTATATPQQTGTPSATVTPTATLGRCWVYLPVLRKGRP